MPSTFFDLPWGCLNSDPRSLRNSLGGLIHGLLEIVDEMGNSIVVTILALARLAQST